MIIRDGGASDLSAVGALHVRSRRHTYRGIIDDEILDAIDPAIQSAKWAARYARETSTHRLLLATGEGGELVGFAYVGAGELYAIHVDPDHHREGIGTALMTACQAALRDLGHDRAALWVLEGNEPACRFYDRDGWIRTGEARQAEVNGASTRQLRYIRYL